MARATQRKWSAKVTRESHALALDKGVFSRRSPRAIALSLKRSAERSRRRKADPYRSALSMLTFYLNRAGKNLPATRRRTLQRTRPATPDLRYRAPFTVTASASPCSDAAACPDRSRAGAPPPRSPDMRG